MSDVYDEGNLYEDTGSEKKASQQLLPEPTPSPPPTKDAQTKNVTCLFWSILWLAVLIAFAWPLSVAMAALYGFVSPLISLVGLDDISESMLQAVNVGRQCAFNVRLGKAMI